MSATELAYLPIPAAPAPPLKQPSNELGPLTATGVIAFLTGLLVFASGFSSLRPNIGGLLLQPCLIPLFIATPFVVLTRLGQFPGRILGFLSLFTAMYCFSALGGPLGEIAKVVSATVMIIVPALLIKTRSDFIAGVFGLIIAVGLLGMRGLEATEVDSYGINPMDVANKNSYSVYALPAILMAGTVLIRFPRLSWWIKLLMAASILASSICIAVSGNRSGWLGLAIVGVMLMKDRKLAGTLVVLLISAVATYWITNFADTTVAERRWEESQEGMKSDDLRVELFLDAFAVAIDNPVLGVAPENLPSELGKRNSLTTFPWIDPHNVFGHVAGGSGLICFVGLLGAGWAMWRWPLDRKAKKLPANAMYSASVSAMHSMIVLWIVRGMFTREILYNPGACIGLGFAIGWCILEEQETRRSKRDFSPDTFSIAAANAIPC